MKQHYRLTIWSLFFLITSSGSAFAQRKTITPIDSLITVGYATGSLKTISGSVEKITETQTRSRIRWKPYADEYRV